MNSTMTLRTSLWQRPAARLAALSAALCATLCVTPPVQASGPSAYYGELMLFGGSFCPQGWLPADGQTLSISNYDALFALLGTTYGGDGVNTFNLPDLRGSAAVGTGNGPGLTPQYLGYQGGAERVTLLPQNLPAHAHSLPASTQPATHATPAPGSVLAAAQNGGAYAAGGTTVGLQGTSVTPSQQPISVRGPYLAMQWCIATTGIYPSRD